MDFDFSPLIGQKVRGVPIEVTEQHTMGFAASVGDVNPLYLDDSQEHGVVAPALFPVRVTWPLMSRLQEFYPEVVPPEILYRLVHGDFQIQLNRLVRPGDTILVTARAVAVQQSKAGARISLKLVGRDRTGDAVFTEHSSVLFRGVNHRGETQIIEKSPALPKPANEGGPRWIQERLIDRQAAHVYDSCTGIHFPIHTSISFARAVGLPDIVLHGTATLAMAVREVVDRELEGDGASIVRVGCQFRNFVIPGESVSFRCLSRRELGEGEGEVQFDVLNARGQVAVRGGVLVFRKK